MRFLHLADLHIGKTLGEYNLIDDQRFILEKIIKLAVERSVDAVLIAGDVFDRSIPSEESVRLFDELLRKLAENHLTACLISGNHDSDERLKFGESLFAASGIHIAAGYDGKLKALTLKDEFGPVRIWLLPFVKASQVRKYFPEEKIDTSYEEALRVILAHEDINFSERNVILAHQFVAGSADPKLAGSEGMSAQKVGTVEKISASLFSEFDYVALGHIHAPQAVGSERIRYAGSPLKYSLSEAEHEKSVPIVTMGERGETEVELVPLIPRRDLRHIRGEHTMLLSPEHVTDPDDYIYVTLTDENPLPNAMGIIRQYYPNTIKIDYDNAHTRAINPDFS